MGSPDTLDFTALLQPIPGSAPAGGDPRQDLSPNSAFGRLKSARSQASAKERLGATDPVKLAESVALWRSIGDLATEILAAGAKDLQVCAWLIESLARSKGFAGLRDGFKLTRELCEKYWDVLHPLPDEEGIATRVAPLAGLNGEEAEGTLIAPIARVAITAGSDGEAFASWHWTKASSQYQGSPTDEAYEARRAQFDAANAELRGRIDAAVRQSGAQFYVDLKSDLEQALEEFAKLGTCLDEKCGANAPPASSVRSAMQAALDTVLAVAKDLLPAAATEGATQGDGATGAAGTPGANGGGPLATRDQAFNQLKQVADFFRRTEPHSPISYLVEQAVRYGGLSLPELLAELIPDDGARAAVFTRTGIKPPSPS